MTIMYHTFTSKDTNRIKEELYKTYADMWKSIAQELLSDKFSIKQIIREWHSKWENILFCIARNENVTTKEFSKFHRIIIEFIVTLETVLVN